MSIIRALLHMIRDEHYRAHFILTLVLLFLGSTFYHFHEEWSWVDSVYFSVITLTTVGYGDLNPTTDLSKLFTIFYIMIGIGILLSFLNMFAERLIEERKQQVERSRRQKNIKRNTYKKKKDE